MSFPPHSDLREEIFGKNYISFISPQDSLLERIYFEGGYGKFRSTQSGTKEDLGGNESRNN